jgi:hypothetical protein
LTASDAKTRSGGLDALGLPTNITKQMKHLILILCLAFATHLSYSEQKSKAKPTARPGPDFTGKVVETMNTAGYTYVLLDTGKEKVWAAGVQFATKKGDTVAISGAMPMQKYHSKTLNRDFEVVYFASAVAVNGKSPQAGGNELPAGHPPIGGASTDLPPGHPPIQGGAPSKELEIAAIKKATGGQTVAEIHANKAALKGKPILVRGKVVKYNAAILGKNWLHIQDPTAKETLVVTTDAEVKKGDTVLVKGNVSTDRDFGAGYKYAVIIENAQITAE